MDGPALLFCEWHPCAAKPKTPIRMSAHASFFGATLATHPALPCRGWFLASMSDPKLSAPMIPSLGTLNKPQWRLLWGNLKAYFMIQFPARTAWGFVSVPSSSTFSTTRNFGNPNNTLNSPLFGRTTRTLASSLGSSGANGTSSTFRRTGETDSQRSASTFDT